MRKSTSVMHGASWGLLVFFLCFTSIKSLIHSLPIVANPMHDATLQRSNRIMHIVRRQSLVELQDMLQGMSDDEIQETRFSTYNMNLLMFVLSGRFVRGALWMLETFPHLPINNYDDNGWTALIYAVQDNINNMESADVVRCLFQYSELVDINVQDQLGRTALMHAAQNGKVGAIELLTSRSNIQLALRDYSSRTAYEYAITSRHETSLTTFLSLATKKTHALLEARGHLPGTVVEALVEAIYNLFVPFCSPQRIQALVHQQQIDVFMNHITGEPFVLHPNLDVHAIASQRAEGRAPAIQARMDAFQAKVQVSRRAHFNP